jgi:hypothetical protein
MHVGCVSFDCHLGLPFFLTSEMHVVISSVSYPFDTTHSLSAEGHSCSDNNTRSLSLSPQKVTRSICVLRCPRRPVLFTAASCARSEDRA